MEILKITKSPIVLKEENKRYAFDSSKEIKGYIKVDQDDEKGLVVVIVENIRFFPKGEYVYKLVLAGTKNERRCYHLVGDISMTAYGSGEAAFRVNVHDLDGNGTSISDFTLAIVAAMSTVNSKESLHPVLKGSLTVPAAAQTPAHAPIPPRDFSAFYNRAVLDNCVALAKEQEGFADIVPFAKDPANAKWKKITDIAKFPIMAPGAEDPMKMYSHFLWGYNDTHYFLAVPGRYLHDEQPDDGRSGFVLWLPILGMEKDMEDSTVPIEERRRNTYGYWIAAINRYNGHIEEFPLNDV